MLIMGIIEYIIIVREYIIIFSIETLSPTQEPSLLAWEGTETGQVPFRSSQNR